jgi:hypothetical protein
MERDPPPHLLVPPISVTMHAAITRNGAISPAKRFPADAERKTTGNRMAATHDYVGGNNK